MEPADSFLKRTWKKFIKRPVALMVAGLIIVGGVLLLLFKKDLQIGGLLGSLIGEKKKPDMRAAPPASRVDESGTVIPPGKSDKEGFTQIPVTATIQKPGFFSDPTKVVIDHPTKGEKIIKLPVGVVNKDVEEVVEIEPDVFEIKNRDKSSVNAKKLLAILE